MHNFKGIIRGRGNKTRVVCDYSWAFWRWKDYLFKLVRNNRQTKWRESLYLFINKGIDGYKIDQTNKDGDISKLRRDRIGIVFQTFNLLALMSAYENI